MDKLVEKFISWWKKPCDELARELFHEEIFIQDCASGNAKDMWLSQENEVVLLDFKLLKAFSTTNDACIIFHQTDELTNLYYRFSIYLRAVEGKIIEVVSTKESVAK